MMKRRLLTVVIAATCFLPLQAQTDLGDFTLDAQIRSRGEYRNGSITLRDQGATPATFINDRVRLSIGWERQNLAIKLSAQHTGVWGDDTQTNNSNKGNITINEAWAKLIFANGAFLQMGRLIVAYDDERLLGALDWATTGRSHDALKLGYEQNQHKLHLILAYNQDAENKINDFYSGKALYKTMQTLWYHYGTTSPWGLSALIINQGVETGDEANHRTKYMQTMGVYASFIPKSPLTANAALYYQTGKDKADRKVNAYMMSLNAKYQLTPQWSLAVGNDYISGTKEGDEKNKTFNVLYGTHHKFYGAMDYFNNSTMPAQGLNDLNATLALKASKEVDFSASVHYFSITKKLDNYDKSLGTEVDLQLNWRVMKDVVLMGGYSVMAATKTLEHYKGGNNNSWQDWAWISLNINPRIFRFK